MERRVDARMAEREKVRRTPPPEVPVKNMQELLQRVRDSQINK